MSDEIMTYVLDIENAKLQRITRILLKNTKKITSLSQ